MSNLEPKLESYNRKRLSEELGYPTYNEFIGHKNSNDIEDNKDEYYRILHDIAKTKGHIPTLSELTDLNAAYLESYISKYGGREVFSQRFSLPLKYNNRYTQIEDVCKAVKKLSKNGYMITHNELYEIGESSLSTAIRKFGGTKKIAKLCGLKTYDEFKGRKPDNYYTEDIIVDRLKKLNKHRKYMITASELSDL